MENTRVFQRLNLISEEEVRHQRKMTLGNMSVVIGEQEKIYFFGHAPRCCIKKWETWTPHGPGSRAEVEKCQSFPLGLQARAIKHGGGGHVTRWLFNHLDEERLDAVNAIGLGEGGVMAPQGTWHMSRLWVNSPAGEPGAQAHIRLFKMGRRWDQDLSRICHVHGALQVNVHSDRVVWVTPSHNVTLTLFQWPH